MLARLHACDADMHGVAERDVDVPGRHALEHALESLGAVWDGGPFADPARRQLVAHATTVADALAELDRLVLRLREIEPRVVLTHGEPHPGNLIRTAGGLVLLDWDTVAAARPERDLWMLAEIDTTLLDRYRDITGITPDAGALRAFRLVWALSDIASFTAQLRAEHGSDTDSRRALVALERILTGHEPCPYGQRQP
jgi:spectinomycin phosphotransferase